MATPAEQLWRAAEKEDVAAIISLIRAGASVDGYKDALGRTALIKAAANGKKEVVPVLLKAGASVNAASNRGGTALILAAANDQKEVVAVLLEAGASVNAANNDGYTALIMAAFHGGKEVVAVLLEAGADVNAVAKYGATALILAAHNGQKEVVPVLLEAGADPTAKSGGGKTARDWAEEKGHASVVALLDAHAAAKGSGGKGGAAAQAPTAVPAPSQRRPHRRPPRHPPRLPQPTSPVPLQRCRRPPVAHPASPSHPSHRTTRRAQASGSSSGGDPSHSGGKRGAAPSSSSSGPAAKKAKAFSVGSHIAHLGLPLLRDAMLMLLGSAPPEAASADQLRTQLEQILLHDGASKDVRAAASWDDALALGITSRCEALLAPVAPSMVHQHLTEVGHDKGLAPAAAYAGMWRKIRASYYPSVHERPPREQKRLLVIAPGFGMGPPPPQGRGTPEQIAMVRASGYQVFATFPPPDYSAAGLQTVLDDIAKYRPDAILCASKGGVYMLKLWEAMAAGSLPKTACLMINAYGACFEPRFELPKGVPIVIAHGSEDDGPRCVRGYTEHAEVEPKSAAHKSLEALIRTGTGGLCYLYHTRTQGGIVQHVGDGHSAPASLREHDTLPRLLDSLIFSSKMLFGKEAGGTPMPAFTFPVMNNQFVHPDRLKAEQFLTYEPLAWVRKFGPFGHKDVRLKRVDPSSSKSLEREEFNAVATIFLSNAAPGAPRFYFPDKQLDQPGRIRRSEAASKLIIERVENGEQEREIKDLQDAVKEKFADCGAEHIGGVNTRWLFHGCSDADTLEKIWRNPNQGFNVGYSRRAAWGGGTYFARDATYTIEGGFGMRCKSADRRYKKIFLCLVECGLPCVGEEHMEAEHLPVVHSDLPGLRYTTFVDSASNPEMFVTPKNHFAYPAYIISFPADIGP